MTQSRSQPGGENTRRTSRPRGLFTLALLGVLMLPATRADAQSCAFLAPGEASLERAPESASGEALAAAASTMSDAGLAVLRHEDVQTRLLADPHRGCNEIDCASVVAATLGVDVTVLVTVWSRQGQPTSVVVTLIDQQGESYGGDAEVTDGVASAAREAAATAHGRWEAAQMGRLIVHTMPEGARVEVDGREVGVSPVTRLVPAGIRQVRAVLEDRRATREVQITARQDTEISLDLVAPPVVVAAADPLPHVIGASIMGAAGLAGLAVGIASAVSGSCTEMLVDGRCAVGSPADEAAVIGWSVAGGVLLAGAVVWLTVGLVSSGDGAVEATLGPGTVGVRGRF